MAHLLPPEHVRQVNKLEWPKEKMVGSSKHFAGGPVYPRWYWSYGPITVLVSVDACNLLRDGLESRIQSDCNERCAGPTFFLFMQIFI